MYIYGKCCLLQIVKGTNNTIKIHSNLIYRLKKSNILLSRPGFVALPCWKLNVLTSAAVNYLSLTFSVRVGRISQIRSGKSSNLTFTNRVEGQYVTLTVLGSQRILTLCEVEIYGYPTPTGENISYYII